MRHPITPIRFTPDDLAVIDRLKKRAKGEDLTTADVVRLAIRVLDETTRRAARGQGRRP